MNASMRPRPLECRDIPAAMQLCEEARWNQTPDDWRMVIERDPDGCFALDIDGELAATTTLVSYGTRLGWVGMVLTREKFRQRGCARVLLRHTLDVAAAKGLRTLKLDATDMGAPLYASLGFTDEQPVERWLGQDLAPLPIRGTSTAGIPEQLDTEAFGVDRSTLVRSLIGRGSVITSNAAYALTRPGRIAGYLGPVVATDGEAASEVIGRAIRDGGKWFWDLLPCNGEAVELARSFGFSPVRKLRRMWLGEPLRGNEQSIFALGGFELG